MGKGSLSFQGLSSIRQRKTGAAAQTSTPSFHPPSNRGGTGKVKKKSGGGSSRLWMRFDRSGAMVVVECDKSTIIKRASIPARDLRILGPLFSQSANILGREKAIVVNLEVIKAIITAEEVTLLDPLCPEVLLLIDRLKQQFPQENTESYLDQEDLQSELPFEFQVLEIALEVLCLFVNSSLASLEREAWPILDELTKNASNENLEYVRSLKTNLTHLLARVQKVRNELEHLLDDEEDMADLYLTRKQETEASNSIVAMTSTLHQSTSVVTSNTNVEDLEMLLETYFMQLKGMRNKILMVRKYIDDTEDYVKIQHNNRRNGLIQFKQILNIISLAVAAGTAVVSLFGMNIPIRLYNTSGIFGYIVWSVAALTITIFMLIFGYASFKNLLH